MTTPVTPPTTAQAARLAQAVAAKAARILALSGAPLGTIGELSAFGVATVRPDYQISELLYGLRFRGWGAAELEALGVTAEQVVRTGMGADPATMPESAMIAVEQALEAALSWVDEELNGGGGIA